MAKDLNKLMLTGRLGKDPELSYANSGTAICKFSLASTDSEKNSSGEWQDKTNWFNVIAFGKTAEVCKNYLKKGSRILCEGKLDIQSYEKDGEKKVFTQVLMNNLIMLDTKGSNGTSEQAESKAGDYVNRFNDGFDNSNDLPF